MRIAIVHSYYSSRQPSGENVVVDAQAAALVAAGNHVHVVARRTDDEERRPLHSVRAAWTVATGVGADPTDELRAFRPDVVHVHNLFPNFGTAWLSRWSGPVVATLHNFRPMCAAGTLYRDGAVCTACPDGDPMAALRNACYRESRVATLPLVASHRGGLLADPVVHRADALVVLTDAAAGIYRRYGVDGHRLHVVPNFVEAPPAADEAAGPDPDVERCWVYVGRLSEEKGIEELAKVWPADVRLDVYGDGPLARCLARLTGPNVHYLGSVDRAELRRRLPFYTGLVFPGRCLEGGYPLSVVEGLAAGLPVVAVAGSSAADLLARNGGGVVVATDATSSDWSQIISAVQSTRAGLSRAARGVYDSRFSRSHWLRSIDAVYDECGAGAMAPTEAAR
jgi:glycosyltransferase involved in cell wall biosynthesis